MAKKQVKPMSVVRAAPIGWEFQYAATAMIGLELLERHGSTLFIEPAGGEDAELTLEIKCGKRVVEIQAKSSQTDIDSSVLAAYLANFPDRRATDNLLARLAQSENRVALFVVGARCNDATRGFLTQAGQVQSHSKSIVTRSHLNDLIAKFAIAHHSKAPSKLESARHAFCQSLAAKLSADHSSATSVAQRIVIWEQLQKDDLEKGIELRVSQEFFVPKTRSRIARLALVEAVRLARDEQVDLIPKLKAVVAEFAGVRILNGSYSHRGQEAQLFDELKQQRVLFLTGQSMCGKSQTARYLAEEFRKGGVTCEIGSNVPEAVRYLNAVGQDDRLFLLDDPFGHLTLNATTAEDLSRLRNLITTLPPHRFLIVTSRNDIIAVAGANPPSPEFIWHDLTVQSPEFLVHFWKTECAGKGLSIAAFNTVLQNLPKMKPSELLQPGQLRHLAHIRDSVPENFLALCRLARRNSADLANSFKLQKGAIQELHAALALGATSIDTLPVHNLNYLLSASESQPGIHLKDEIETVRLGCHEPPPPFPADPNVAPISAIQSDELSLLEQRGFIRVCQNQITFAHPDYFEASTLVLLGAPATRFKKILEIASLAVTGLDPAVAKRALRQLPRMYDSYALPEQRSDFIKLAFLALNSIFPSVRDLALTTLVSWIDVLKKDDQERVLNFVAHSNLRFDDILWQNGIPWLNPKPRANVDRLFGIGRVSIKQAKEAQLVARLLDPLKSSLSINEAWVLVTAFKSKPKNEISFPALKALMRYEEGFIRAETAFLLIANLQSYDEEAVTLALGDEHPAVVFEGVRGCFEGWETFGSDLRLSLQAIVRQTFEKIAVVACANRFVVDFGESEGFGDSNKSAAKWLLWAEVVPVFLRTISAHSVWINQANLWHTTKHAREHLNPEIGLSVCQGWLGWIEAKLKHSLPDDYGFALAQFLIEVTRNAPAVRSKLSAHLLSHSDTAFLLSNFKEYLAHWPDLTTAEHEFVLCLCRSNRKDNRWIRALPPTRENPPPEVIDQITGAKSLSILSTEDLITLLPGELIQDCLNIYTGEHPIFYYLGFSYSSHEPWHRLLEYFVEHPELSLFDLALREMFRSRLNGQSLWSNAHRVWAKLCTSADKSLRERLFVQLLTWTIRINSNSSGIFWRVFFNKIKVADEYADYIRRIIENIEAVEMASDDLPSTFGRKRFYDEMLSKLPGDYLALKSMMSFDEPALRIGCVELLKTLYQKSPPRLNRLHDLVIDYLKNCQNSSKFEEEVEEYRHRGIDTASAQRKKFDDVYPEFPPAWTS